VTGRCVPVRSDAPYLIASAVLVTVIDQVSKSLVTASLSPNAPTSRLDLVPGWLAIAYAENRGAAFGLFGAISSLLPLIGIALVIALLVHYCSETRPSLTQTLAMGAIVGGAVGNLIDRLRLGYVIDFISLGPWPNFNVADSAVTVGVLVLVWTWARVGQRHESPRPG
jgi:signal peptidase II